MTLTTTWEANFYNQVQGYLQDIIDEKEFKFFIKSNYSADSVDTSKAVSIWEKHGYLDKYSYSLYSSPNAAGIIALTYGSAEVHVAGKTRPIAENFLHKLRDYCKPVYNDNPNEISVNFWAVGPHGASSSQRTLQVPTWEEIKHNYSSNVVNALDGLFSSEYRPGRGGLLYLWTGIPGTGKTYALRALGQAWKPWADVHYITDPEKFFGAHADYMLQVILDTDDSHSNYRLLVLEDCGELISRDAKMISGQGLSRLLNTVDGLIGQGLKFTVLITTNEELKDLHPAIIRPGRCALNCEFTTLNRVEIDQWCAINGMDEDSLHYSYATVAELYAEKEGRSNKNKGKTLGFVA